MRKVFLLLTLLLVAVAHASDEDRKPCLSAQPDEAARQRLILNEGYSILRHDARTIAALRWLIFIKVESDPYEKLVTDAAEFGRELEDDLDRVAKDYPAVRIDLDPLPTMERRKRLATGVDKFFDIFPFTGRTGAAYERTVLISLSNGLNQERHLAHELAKEEPDAGLKRLMAETETKMNRLHEQAEDLLERRYYRAANGSENRSSP